MSNLIIRIIFVVFIQITFLSTAYAEGELKIGAVNAIRLLESSPQSEVARKRIENEFAPRDKELVAEQKRIKALEDKLAKDGAIMSESERKKLERDIINKKRELKRSQEEFQEDFNFRRNEEFSKIQKDIFEAINAVAKEHKYDIVLGEGVIFASPDADMSGLVIEYLKKQNGGN